MPTLADLVAAVLQQKSTLANPAQHSIADNAYDVLVNGSSGGGGITPPVGDIGGTTSVPTIISTHLTAPLPVAQGGTGTTTGIPTGLMRYCSGIPGSSLGIDGDYATDITSGAIWGPKASGAWPATWGYWDGQSQLKPAVAVTEPLSRAVCNIAGAVLSTGRLLLLTVFWPAGTVINNIVFQSMTTGAGTPLNQWVAIFNRTTLARLAVGTDLTTTAWTAGSLQTFPISYTVPTSGLYYVGLLVVATTMPSLLTSPYQLNSLTPLTVVGTNGLTTPATCPNPVTTAGSNNSVVYLYTT